MTKPLPFHLLKKRKTGIDRPLTIKQKVFANEYVRTRNGRSAAMKAYNVKRREIAGVVASATLKKPHVALYVEQAMKEAGYNPVTSIQRLMSIEERGAMAEAKVSDSLKATDTLLKLSGALGQKKSSTLKVEFDNLDTIELMKLKEKYDKLLSS